MKKIENKNINVSRFKDYETPWFFDIEFKNLKYKEYAINELSKNQIETRQAYPALSKQKYLKSVERTDLSYSEKNLE